MSFSLLVNSFRQPPKLSPGLCNSMSLLTTLLYYARVPRHLKSPATTAACCASSMCGHALLVEVPASLRRHVHGRHPEVAALPLQAHLHVVIRAVYQVDPVPENDVAANRNCNVCAAAVQRLEHHHLAVAVEPRRVFRRPDLLQHHDGRPRKQARQSIFLPTRSMS